MNPLRQHVDDLLEQIRAIEQFTADGRESFLSDLKTQYAVIRAYEVIGEVVKRIPAAVLNQYPGVEWKQIAGFRDFLIHRYDEVDLKVVWGAVEKLELLKIAVEAILRMLEKEQDENRKPDT